VPGLHGAIMVNCTCSQDLGRFVFQHSQSLLFTRWYTLQKVSTTAVSSARRCGLSTPGCCLTYPRLGVVWIFGGKKNNIDRRSICPRKPSDGKETHAWNYASGDTTVRYIHTYVHLFAQINIYSVKYSE